MYVAPEGGLELSTDYLKSVKVSRPEIG